MFFLDFDTEEHLNIGAFSRTQEISNHELFFKLNRLNPFRFRRTADLIVEDHTGRYEFPKFEAYDEMSRTHFIIIENKSCAYQRKTPIGGLFDFIENKFFVREDLDFIIFAKEEEADFSRISLPLEFVSAVEEHQVSSEDELYAVILNYDE